MKLRKRNNKKTIRWIISAGTVFITKRMRSQLPAAQCFIVRKTKAEVKIIEIMSPETSDYHSKPVEVRGSKCCCDNLLMPLRQCMMHAFVVGLDDKHFSVVIIIGLCLKAL